VGGVGGGGWGQRIGQIIFNQKHGRKELKRPLYDNFTLFKESGGTKGKFQNEPVEKCRDGVAMELRKKTKREGRKSIIKKLKEKRKVKRLSSSLFKR